MNVRSEGADHRVVRWGVLGSAWVNTLALPGLLAAENSELVAMSSRDLGRAEADAARWGARKAFGSYVQLLEDTEVDAIYIPLPNTLHKEWTITALRAGKHVLCEKPLALSADEVSEIADVSRETDRVVLEAFMYQYAPRWLRAMELVHDGTIGQPKAARLFMGFKQIDNSDNIRFDASIGGGAIWDMGCYTVSKARRIFEREPISVYAAGWSRPGQRVDTTSNFILDFGDGASAMCTVSFDFVNPYSQDEVVGTEGWLNMPGTGFRDEAFTRLQWYSRRYGADELYIDGVEPVTESFRRNDNFHDEFHYMSDCILRGIVPQFGLHESLLNARVLEAVVTSAQNDSTVTINEVQH